MFKHDKQSIITPTSHVSRISVIQLEVVDSGVLLDDSVGTDSDAKCVFWKRSVHVNTVMYCHAVSVPITRIEAY